MIYMKKLNFTQEGKQFVYETDVYRITCRKKDITDALLYPLIEKTWRLALLFGLSRLPVECKICINIMERDVFTQQKNIHFGKIANSEEIVAFSGVNVSVLSYSALRDKYTLDEYCKVILHETVHVLQRITTMVPTEDNVWLYEAVACYLAGQMAKRPQKKEAMPWDTVKQNFYAVPKCYSIAYHLGKALLADCPSSCIVDLCSDVPRCEETCAKAYTTLFI